MNWIERNMGGHIHLFGRPNEPRGITLYGSNAMHFAVNIYTKRWGYLCFRPTVYDMGRWWRWYFYVSRDGTPQSATYRVGPGLRD